MCNKKNSRKPRVRGRGTTVALVACDLPRSLAVGTNRWNSWQLGKTDRSPWLSSTYIYSTYRYIEYAGIWSNPESEFYAAAWLKLPPSMSFFFLFFFYFLNLKLCRRAQKNFYKLTWWYRKYRRCSKPLFKWKHSF